MDKDGVEQTAGVWGDGVGGGTVEVVGQCHGEGRATCDLRRGHTGIEIPILLYMRNAA